ncbi:MAG TPA: adenylate kinase [Paludibacteraceae bacterium]|nr:adenylate kinase [Paludibacteraceae bacterium]HQB69501.1 adenylate kinase [Paludibacteraceae bacterium]HRS67327.1 adenylate kinase [Paludibacteraceae bacterium]
MLNIVIFGPPGSGKGTQSKLIAEKYQLVHLSTGDMLRAEIARGTEVGKQVDKLISNGNFAPDDIIIDMINHEINAHKQNCNGFIFDGFPRTVAQAKALDVLLAEHDKKLTLMLDLHVEENVLIERLLKRGLTSGRADDNLEVIKKRLEIHKEKSLPVLNYYKNTGRYVSVPNSSTIEENFEHIVHLIEFSICGF